MYKENNELANKAQQIYVREGERPAVKCLFEVLGVGDTLHIPFDPILHNSVKYECYLQNEKARAVGGELNIFFRTKKKGDEILIYRLK